MLLYRTPFLLLTAALLLALAPAQAQKVPPPLLPAPPPPQKVLTVQLTLPTLVGRLGEMTGILARRDKKKGTSTDNPVLFLAVPLPRLFSGGSSPKDAGK
ncbi:hypothetical protein [Hymenobacter rubripertinctus]|uniref:Uncharacterized protein n=1 Tax=Hymenobacter rubripertinctus TaxID=2029981 RepID=A0A418QQS3_9BACT|nr:hypothetical protein [Hymenobacter rubripertinctus]RIY07597.1 hypothetical protein D0T11_16080 [Hymenobacter rubripertinctus]